MTALDATTATPRRDLRVISLIGTAHFFSHFYILILPPLFPLLRDVYEVSYTALGLALAVLNGVTALTQAPVGFLVDRFGPRALLVAGLALFSLATGLIGLFPTYPMLLALMVLAGLGNSVFHPADYAILSSAVDQRRMGRAFSIHTFGGHAGFALAPPVIVFLTAAFDWRIALALAAAPGLVVSLLLALSGDLRRTAAGPATCGRRPGGAGRCRDPPVAERADPHGAAVLRHAGDEQRRLHQLQRRRDRVAVPGAARRGEPAAHPLSRVERRRGARGRLGRRSDAAASPRGRLAASSWSRWSRP